MTIPCPVSRSPSLRDVRSLMEGRRQSSRLIVPLRNASIHVDAVAESSMPPDIHRQRTEDLHRRGRRTAPAAESGCRGVRFADLSGFARGVGPVVAIDRRTRLY